MKKISWVGVDIAKYVFQVHSTDARGKAIWRARLSRDEWLSVLCEHVPTDSVIAMEACASAHHWARELRHRGYTVKLIAAQFVKPYVKSNKNDAVDAAAICEALSRPDMRFVAIKSIEQQDNQAMHRIRSELVAQRTAKANQIRGLVGEYGITAPGGIAKLRQALPEWLEGEGKLSASFCVLLQGLYDDLKRLDERVASLDKCIAERVAQDPAAQRLMQLRGVGPLIASALTGALGDGKAFGRGRDFAASLGLTPRQHSSGGKERLLGISKRGDPYLRKLLVHGARAVIRYVDRHDDALSCWIKSMLARKHTNVVTVALANKTARIAWAIVHGEVDSDPSRMAAKALKI